MKFKENNFLNYSGSYDAQFDILRINNQSVDSFYYEDFDSKILLMLDDESDNIIGAQIFDFLSDEEMSIRINRLPYNNLKDALNKIYHHYKRESDNE